MHYNKTRAIGKWHGLQNVIHQSFSSPLSLTKQDRKALRWSVDCNLFVTRFEVLQ
jgi:hypothetical protein